MRALTFAILSGVTIYDSYQSYDIDCKRISSKLGTLFFVIAVILAVLGV